MKKENLPKLEAPNKQQRCWISLFLFYVLFVSLFAAGMLLWLLLFWPTNGNLSSTALTIWHIWVAVNDKHTPVMYWHCFKNISARKLNCSRLLCEGCCFVLQVRKRIHVTG